MGDDPTSPTPHRPGRGGLHAVRLGDGAGGPDPRDATRPPPPPVVLVHGFTQDHRCLGPLGTELARRGTVVAVDAPGHGGSRHLAAADLPTTADLLAAVLADLADAAGAADGPVDLVGYSMGGRMALRTAVDHPYLVRRLVLIGATPGIEDPADRAARAEQDRATAARIESEGLDAFVDDWLAGPLFAGLPPEFRFDAERREQDPTALATSLRCAGTGSMAPLWDRLGDLDVPVCCLAGAEDLRFAGTAGRMAALARSGTAVLVPGAGHAAHLEAPDDVVRAVLAHLDG